MNINRIFLATLLINSLVASSFFCANNKGVTFSKEEARSRVNECLPDKFMQQLLASSLIEKIAGKTRPAMGISNAVRFTIFEEFKKASEPVPATPVLIDLWHDQITRCLLQNHPDAIEELETKGMLLSSE